MERSLDELLNDEEFNEPVEAEAETQPREEDGRFATKETGVEPQDEPQAVEVYPVPPTPDKLPPETFKGLKEEREKRQTLERELANLRQQIEANQQPQAAPPSIWEDDEGALAYVKNEAVTQAVQQATLNAKLDMSEMMVRQSNADFEEVKAEFLALAQDNPVLVQQALADPHPWNKAYQIAKNARTMRDLGATDLDTLKAKMREELLAEMQAQVPAAPAGLPPTLSTQRNVGQRTGPAWSGPRSLDELLS